MKAVKFLAGIFLAQSAYSLAAFADCDSALESITVDKIALEKIKALHESNEWKFSS